MAEITLKDINKTLKAQAAVDVANNRELSHISGSLNAFVRMLQQEEKSEALKSREEVIEGGAKPPGGKEKLGDGKGLFGGLMEALAGLIPALSTVVGAGIAALVASFSEGWNDFSRTLVAGWFGVLDKFKGLFTGFFGMFGAEGIIGGQVVRLGKAISSFFTDLRGPMLVFDDAANSWRNIETGRFAKAPGVIQRALMGFTNMVDNVGKDVSNLFGPESSIGKFAGKIKSAFTIAEDSPIMTAVDKAGKIFGALGDILKKIFFPIGLIFTAYDVIKGAIEGYGDEKSIVGAIGGAITGLLKSIVGAPLNLLKSAVSWVLEQFGFEDISKWIDENLDFEKLIGDLGTAVINWFKGLGGNSEDAARDLEQNPQLQEPIGLTKGTLGTMGTLFGNFGAGTPAILHGEEAVIPKNSGMGRMLGQIMDRSSKAGFQKFAMQTGAELKAKEDAMRAAGASDMDIAQSIMGDMPGIMGSLKGIGEKMDLGSIQQPKMGPNPIKQALQPNNLGNLFGSMVREAEENKKAQATRAPAPVIISDNSSRSSNTSNTAMPLISKPFDFDDPFVAGIRT